MTSTPLKIIQAIQEIQSGENIEENFFLLYREYGGALNRYFSGKGAQKDSCEDLTQEVFFRVYHSIKGFRGEGEFMAWLMTIANHVLLDDWKWRNAGKRIKSPVSLDGVGWNGDGPEIWQEPPDPSPHSNPLNALIDREQEQMLEAEINKLSKRQIQCLQLKRRGYKNEQIAIILEISTETVKSHLSKARETMRDAMGLDQ